MPLPTLVIAGAQKSGTTTLHDLLAQHPQILMSSPKELHFFDKYFDRGIGWYASCFAPDHEHRQWGEATPVYMYQRVARERMVRTLPDARFICVLRDPVARAYSHYWHAREKGPEKARSFEEALEREPDRLARHPDRQPAAFSYVERGKYIEQLRPLLAAVGRTRLHVLLMHDLLGSPEETMRAVFEFLDVDSGMSADLLVATANQYGGGEANRQATERPRRPRDRADLPVGGYPPMDEDTKRRLRSVFAPYNQALSEWLDRPLTEWGT